MTGPRRRRRVAIDVWAEGARRARQDTVATEEPLQIRVRWSDGGVVAAVTMRTPGDDFELAAGFLLAEGLVGSAADIERMSHCADRQLSAEEQANVVHVELAGDPPADVERFERHFTITSACGVCGRQSVDDLMARVGALEVDDWRTTDDVILGLPDALARAQAVFRSTGGLHAAASFEPSGELDVVREDVGRHNALDKVLGVALLGGRIPHRRQGLVVSGRASYELVMKAVVAGAPMLCAVSAPSSLAVDLAKAFELTLVGFLRDGRFNVYAAGHRIRHRSP